MSKKFDNIIMVKSTKNKPLIPQNYYSFVNKCELSKWGPRL